MLTKRIIPCLDVNGGRVVKGINFVNLMDAGDPVEVGRAYGQAGADELVFLDITASSDQRDTVVDMVRKVAEQVFIRSLWEAVSAQWRTSGCCCGREQIRFPLIRQPSAIHP